MQNKIIVIFGPTSSGKTTLSLDIAEYIFEKYHLKSEMISADSRQVYEGMNIGTAKLTFNIRKKYPHHCLDALAPTQQHSAKQFQEEAQKIIESVISRGNIPVIVGGTGTYVMSLVGDTYLTKSKHNKNNRYRSLMLIPSFEKQSLYRKIEANIDKMFQDGLYTETKNIISTYHAVPKQLGKTHGYREFIEYAKRYHKNVFRLNDLDLAKIKYRIKIDTKKYAMHQTAWLEKMKGYNVVGDAEQAKPIIDNFLSQG